MKMGVKLALLEDPAIQEAIDESPKTLEKRLNLFQSQDFLRKISQEFQKISDEYSLESEENARHAAYHSLMQLRFPKIDPSFFSIRDGKGFPKFAAYSPHGTYCDYVEDMGLFVFNSSVNLRLQFEDFSSGPRPGGYVGLLQALNLTLGNHRTGYWVPNVINSQMKGNWSNDLSSDFRGIVPKGIKNLLSAVEEYFDPVFLVAEAQWNEKPRPIKDPLVIGVKNNECFLLGAYNCTLPEVFVKEHFVR